RSIKLTQPDTSITPSTSPNIKLNPSKSSPCDCSWAILSSTNVEFLVTNPSGQQEGYLQASNSYINNIPDASYGIEGGIGDTSREENTPPSRLYFGMNNPENGIYKLQIIGKKSGKYHLDVSFAWGPMNGKTTSIDGTLTTNQID